MCSCQGQPTENPSTTTSSPDVAETPKISEKIEMPAPEMRFHPAFRDNTPVPSSSTDDARSGSTTPDSASISVSAGTGSVVTGTSEQSNKFVGGSHQMSDVKLPGYWTHERTAELKEMAKTNDNIVPVPDPKAAPSCDKCEEEKNQGLFKEEVKRKGFFRRILRRKS